METGKNLKYFELFRPNYVTISFIKSCLKLLILLLLDTPNAFPGHHVIYCLREASL